MTDPIPTVTGLTAREAAERLASFGPNELVPQKKPNFFKKVLGIIAEPMFLLLIVAAVVYFVLGEPRDGAIMLIFVIGIISIDVIQEWKTDRTLSALRDLSAPHTAVIRDGQERQIASRELVPGDLMLLREGVKIPADGVVLQQSDLCVDESSLTGEAEGVWKTASGADEPTGDHWRRDYCYAGTLVTQGSGLVRVEATGAATEYGHIGAAVQQAPEDKTPLQKQTAALVKASAILAIVLCIVVAFVTYFNLSDHVFRDRVIESILSGITLAMAMIPEEFPVILTVFLSMGAWRLAKKQSLVRKLPSVETLGAVTVLCVDKTGTITVNRMAVSAVAPLSNCTEEHLLQVMGRACEQDAYDPMEQAMLACCAEHGLPESVLFSGELIHEYPFTNARKMMGHVWTTEDGTCVMAKGSPERILTLCAVPQAEKDRFLARAAELSADGLRVIAVAEMPVTADAVPNELEDCRLMPLGLVGLSDPPRAGVRENIETCARAGVRVVMITGDNGVTASAIAKKVGMPHSDRCLTGDEIERMSDESLREAVREVSIFSRVVPAHKMRIVRAFRDNGEIVAMTGDGVNDAPALKYADIGIAMGKRGSEVSREAADLILMDDNFSTIVDTIRDGRRIYDNIRKAVGYVFVIHIPIALSSLLAPLIGIAPAALLLLPLHVVLLELIIDPTCSIVLERQPAERDIMERGPRRTDEKLLGAGTLIKSVLQGLAIFAAMFGVYVLTYRGVEANAAVARSMGLAVVMLANLFLVQVNSSDRDPAWRSFARLLRDRVMWAVNIGTLLLLAVVLYTPLHTFLKLAPLSFAQALTVLGLAAASVLWYELVKLIKRHSANRRAARR